MTESEKQLKEILLVMSNEGILKNIIMIGSWCLLFYKYIFDNFEPSIKTTDLDFYVPDVKSIRGSSGLINSLKEINYDVVYDSMTHKTTFISPDGFEIEFLTKLNRNQVACVKIGNTGVFAESLSYVEIFSANYLEIDFYDIPVKVASPASYVIQKLLILETRKLKEEKDIKSIENVLFYIKASGKYVDELKKLYESLPKKWKKKVNDSLNNNNIILF